MKYFLLLALFLIRPAFAGKGMIIVLEAPILSERSLDSKVIQLTRKGDIVFIHDKYFINSPYEPNYDSYSDNQLELIELAEEDEDRGYYQTVDRNGNTGWIPQKYVKLVYKDSREELQSATPYKKTWDPTDYRLEEPIPDHFPLMNRYKRRALLAGGVGNAQKTNYPYRDTMDQEDFLPRAAVRFAYTSKVDWDEGDRFYFGGIGQLNSSGARFRLLDTTIAEEARMQLGLGPYVSYDVYRNMDYRLTFAGSLTVNYERMLVSIKAPTGDSEERSFTGYSVTPRVSPYFSFREVFPSVDFVVGMELQMILPTTLKSSTPIVVEDLWQQNPADDVINIPFGGNATFYIGLNSIY